MKILLGLFIYFSLFDCVPKIFQLNFLKKNFFSKIKRVLISNVFAIYYFKALKIIT